MYDSSRVILQAAMTILPINDQHAAGTFLQVIGNCLDWLEYVRHARKNTSTNTDAQVRLLP